MGKIIGRLFVTHIGAAGSEVLIAVQDSTDIEFKNDLQEAITVNDAGFESFIDGIRGWSANVNLKYDQANTHIDGIIEKIIDPAQSTDLTVLIGQYAVTSDIAWEGIAKIANAKITSQVKTTVTMSLALQGTGGLTKRTKPI